ncbi:MAG: glycosyltransferase, partial [Nocardioidaceae bacterium]
VRAAIAAAGLDDRIEAPGSMPRADAWAGADLALLPSLVESFGMVVTEALARGVPAVVSEGGAAEALGAAASGARPGAVVPTGDAAALADTMRRWLTDTGYREQLRTAALARRATLERWEVTARRVREALTRR